MIIVVCTDDLSLIGIADQSITANPVIFGKRYTVFHDTLPQLGSTENLFIIAHGAFNGDEGLPVIGDEHAAFYVDGSVLYHNIFSIFPSDYTANVYIDACESADGNKDTLSFCQTFLLALNLDHPAVNVFGVNGASSGVIPVPSDSKWIKAEF